MVIREAVRDAPSGGGQDIHPIRERRVREQVSITARSRGGY
jgi:hypothetical protein